MISAIRPLPSSEKSASILKSLLLAGKASYVRFLNFEDFMSLINLFKSKNERYVIRTQEKQFGLAGLHVVV